MKENLYNIINHSHQYNTYICNSGSLFKCGAVISTDCLDTGFTGYCEVDGAQGNYASDIAARNALCEGCSDNDVLICSNNDIYYYNDCSGLGSKATECGTLGCTSGQTTCNTCTPNWVTGSWSECSSSCTQTRTVTDSNNCGVTTGKPAISQSCTGGNCGSTGCTDGQTEICSVNVGSTTCAGTSTCTSGTWGSCVKNDANCGTSTTSQSQCLTFIQTCDPEGSCQSDTTNCKISSVVWILLAALGAIIALKVVGGIAK